MRWVRFSLVGGMGAVVQSAALHLLLKFVCLNYLPATAIAVEAAILHNFFWHVNWTFSDRQPPAPPVNGRKGFTRHSHSKKSLAKAFLRFQLQAGLISIPGNLALMWVLVEGLQIPIAAANLVSIVACSWANYQLAVWFSFKHHASTSAQASVAP